MNLVTELYAVVRALALADIEFAVCGGIAVTVYGFTRTTKDIDILIHAGDVPRILDAVRPLGYIFAALPMTFDAGTERERHVLRITKVEGNDHLVLDLLFADAAFRGMLEERVEIQLPSGTLSVVPLETLKKMKRLAGRPQDAADLAKLEHPDEV